ncbi:MAG: nucleotidyltransferase domain-containing protein [Elusimicrobia bacterium]|nr:nucleotidyltransferase domain-containing protein [Elusimicrobiota bacterium]MBP9128513.1 nucleotidyltransferase domain-containing protein [Elusimicrobiota bacterium]
MLSESQQNKIHARLKEHDVRLLYLFGSAARGEMTKDSDYDLAVLTGKPFPPEDRFQCGLDLGVLLNRDVDLIDLREASEPLKIQVIQKGIPLYMASPHERAVFEMIAISDYTRFNEERRPAINRIRESGRIYGQ